MEKRIIENNEEEDTVIRAVRAKREEREKIRLEKDAYITRVISEMEIEMVFTPETVQSTVESCEKEVIESHTDEKYIRMKLDISDCTEGADAKANAYRKVLDDAGLRRTIDEAYEKILKEFRQRVADEWNKKHPKILAETRTDKYLYIGYDKN